MPILFLVLVDVEDCGFFFAARVAARMPLVLGGIYIVLKWHSQGAAQFSRGFQGCPAGMPVKIELRYNPAPFVGTGLEVNSDMPIYEYQCTDCGHRLEALQKISDAPLKDCPGCSGQALARLVSAPSFRLKGGGWYETDFKTGNRKHGTADSPAAPVAKPSDSAVAAPSASAD
jgi:putative FmdB family regulatory protein